MKKIKFLIIALFLTVSSFSASATEPTVKEPVNRAQEIENRVHEIWKMDFSKMDNIEKQALKHELKALKKEMKTSGLDSKVSISVGAIIIILLLIIIIS